MGKAEPGLPVLAAIEQGLLSKPCMEHDEHDGPEKAPSCTPLSHQVQSILPSYTKFVVALDMLGIHAC